MSGEQFVNLLNSLESDSMQRDCNRNADTVLRLIQENAEMKIEIAELKAKLQKIQPEK